VDSTAICWQCGELAESGASLKLVCANGHEWDQDQNAARNLFSQIDGTFTQTHELRKSEGVGSWKRLVVPETIGAVIIEVPAK
jgi:hypothetical protein